MSHFTINQLAHLAGITVRTLHYYDEIGLLKPLRIASNGYRYYGQAELETLQQILYFRELDFSLSEIKKMMGSRQYDALSAMQDQKKLLELKKQRLEAIIQTLSTTINTMKGGGNMNNDVFDSLSDKQLEEYKEEAKQRWGNTEAYKQSVERSKNWTKEDIMRVQQEWGKLLTAVADTMDNGADSPEAQKAVADIYQHLYQFYDPSLEMFQGLGQMYVDDLRFRETFEKVKPGLAEYTRDAINVYVHTQKK